MISKFLAVHKEFELVENDMINIIPDEEKDGFFICKIHKK